MVLLTMTAAVVAVVELYLENNPVESNQKEPSLDAPEIGNPISHGQLIDISKYLKSNPEKVEGREIEGRQLPTHLGELLKGCSIYRPPPKPKPEPSSEYKTLMARLRKEEENRSYKKMLHPTSDPFNPRISQGHLFPPTKQESEEDDEVTYADINRQMALIANVLISIVACSIAIWKAAWHWPVPSRLALAMAGSVTVAVAEVAIYAGYLGRIADAKKVERKKVEKKTIQSSWVIEGRKEGPVRTMKKMVNEGPATGLRQRTAQGGK
ncbi:hypothetical protein Vi05172_g12630 [Venturia inaequalis]|nr:hypothetical protein Vi05172_g12630 [Venturia inaequalis]